MGEVAEFRPAGAIQSAAHIRDQVNRVQEVMKSVMKRETHYGVIPGTGKPTLYKAGSEVLLSMFRIAVSVQVEDLSNDDCIRYRVRTIGTHQTSGIVVGEGIGECSSNEEKYKWRKATKAEFTATPEARRRIKYGYDRGKQREYEMLQVRAEPADVANTVLKMAKKRAQIDLTLTATAASDIFTQDIEDLPEDMREQLAEEERAHHPPAVQTPRAKATTGGTTEPPAAGSPPPTQAPPGAAESPADVLSENRVQTLRQRLTAAQLSEAELCMAHNLTDAGGKPAKALHVGMKADVKVLSRWIRQQATERS